MIASNTRNRQLISDMKRHTPLQMALKTLIVISQDGLGPGAARAGPGDARQDGFAPGGYRPVACLPSRMASSAPPTCMSNPRNPSATRCSMSPALAVIMSASPARVASASTA